MPPIPHTHKGVRQHSAAFVNTLTKIPILCVKTVDALIFSVLILISIYYANITKSRSVNNLFDDNSKTFVSTNGFVFGIVGTHAY